MNGSRWLLRLTALLAVVASPACDRGRATATVVERDSAGFRIVENHADPATLPEWRILGEPLVDIGGGPDSTQELFDVAGAARFPDGRLVIAEDGYDRLRFYDAAGVWIMDVGRSGEGPGEFRDLSTPRLVAGDSILVWDTGLDRFSLFTPDGSFVRTWRIEQPLPDHLVTPFLMISGSGFLARPGFSFSSDTPTGVHRVTIPYLRFRFDGSFIDSVGSYPGAETFVFSEGGSTIAASLPFLRSTHLAAAAEGFWLGTADAWEIERRLDDGRILFLLRRPAASLELSGSKLDEWTNGMIEGMEPSQRPFWERFVAGIPEQETVPAYTDLETDTEGNLWVREFAWPGESDVAWHVFDPAGRLFARATLPAELTVSRIDRDWILGMWSDALGVEHVRVVRLERSAQH